MAGSPLTPTSDGRKLLTARLPREVDAANEARVRLDLLAMIDAYAPQVSGLIVDMTHTRFIDSAGLRAILAVRAHAVELGAALWSAAPSPEARRFLSLVDIAGTIPVFDSVDIALVAWSARPGAATTVQRSLALLDA